MRNRELTLSEGKPNKEIEMQNKQYEIRCGTETYWSGDQMKKQKHRK
jgi:hypothetical protein